MSSHPPHTHYAKIRARAGRKLSPPAFPAATGEASARALRAFLATEEERLRLLRQLGASGRAVARTRSLARDALVTQLFAALAPRDAGDAQTFCAVVALGGYGRGELSPFSDLDLLFLHDGRHEDAVRRLLESLLPPLWDAGLTVGHSSHAVRQCLAAAREDLHLRTALAHARLVAGDEALFQQLVNVLERRRRKEANKLVAAVCEARDARQRRHGAIVYLQEPDVKEGVGGLRDWHEALWAAEARFGARTLMELHARGHVSDEGHGQIERAYDFLLRVREALHRAANRKTDRLSLERQTALAAGFGYADTPHLRASEQFMRDYYRRARALHRAAETLLERAAPARKPARWFVARPRDERLSGLLAVEDGELRLTGEARAFGRSPLLLFETVALAQAAGARVGPALRDAVTGALAAVGSDFRRSPEAARAFLALLRRRGRAGRALRLMHETGLLGRYLPEFARVSLLIQHDLYHHYTIDEHTLRAVEALDALVAAREAEGQHAQFFRAVFAEVEDPALLYLSVLLHDVGKGRGSGHVARGARIAEGVCARLRLGAGEAAKVVRTVSNHVLMAHVSQRRDLRDARTAPDFAARVGGLDELNMLTLLTYADLHAVGPGVWSEWKAALLQELYTRARPHVTGGHAPLRFEEHAVRLKERVLAEADGSFAPSEIERHFALLPARYAHAFDAAAVLAHLGLIARLSSDRLACRWARHEGATTGLTVAARDRRGLFAELAGALAAQGLEILSAELNTRADGVALDHFVLRSAATGAAVEPERWPAVERALAAAVEGSADVAAAVERWRVRHAPRRRHKPNHHPHARVAVRCDNEAAEGTTLVEVRAPDEHGLAYRVARTLAARGLDIVCARVATEKSDALDVFYVTDAGGAKLDAEAVRGLTEALTEALSPAGACTAEGGAERRARPADVAPAAGGLKDESPQDEVKR